VLLPVVAVRRCSVWGVSARYRGCDAASVWIVGGCCGGWTEMWDWRGGQGRGLLVIIG
jgi:hypothetical protein